VIGILSPPLLLLYRQGEEKIRAERRGRIGAEGSPLS
jgi:hypothetical protein